jgi:hypothetical protein
MGAVIDEMNCVSQYGYWKDCTLKCTGYFDSGTVEGSSAKAVAIMGATFLAIVIPDWLPVA